MKKLMLSVFALAAVVLSANAATPSSGSQTGYGKAELLSPIAVSTLATAGAAAGTLEYGRLIIPATEQSITLTPTIGASLATAFTSTDAGTMATSGGSVKSTAGFRIAGVKGQTVYIHLPASANLTNATDGDAADLVISDFVTSLSLNTGNLSGTTGQLDFFVGGKLTVPASAYAGLYAGSYTVTVDYE